MTTSLLLASAAALGITFTTAMAREPFFSPKDAALRNDLRRIPTVEPCYAVSTTPYLGAAAKWELNRLKVVPGGTVTPALAGGTYLGAAAKSPYAKPASFEIAPLAGNGTAGNPCEPGCTKECCVKK